MNGHFLDDKKLQELERLAADYTPACHHFAASSQGALTRWATPYASVQFESPARPAQKTS